MIWVVYLCLGLWFVECGELTVVSMLEVVC